MTVKTGVSGGTTDIATTDTAIMQVVANSNRERVEAFTISNTTGGTVVVDIYESPDLTTASGKRIAQYTLTAESSAQVVEAIGQSLIVGRNIIAIADVVGSNATHTKTTYDGSS